MQSGRQAQARTLRLARSCSAGIVAGENPVCRGNCPVDLLWGMQRSALNQFIGHRMFLYNKWRCHCCRWAKERYQAARDVLVATLRRMQAGAAQPYVLRSQLREQARKSIGAPLQCTLVLDRCWHVEPR